MWYSERQKQVVESKQKNDESLKLLIPEDDLANWAKEMHLGRKPISDVEISSFLYEHRLENDRRSFNRDLMPRELYIYIAEYLQNSLHIKLSKQEKLTILEAAKKFVEQNY
jgi:hypothetical protein